jgi:hypothetical protein
MVSNNNKISLRANLLVGLLRYRRDSIINLGGHVPLQLARKVSLTGER